MPFRHSKVPTDQMWSTITINLCALQSASKVHYPSSPTARVWHAVMYYHSAIFLLPLLLCRSRNIISQNDDCSSCGGSGRDNDGDDIGRKKGENLRKCFPLLPDLLIYLSTTHRVYSSLHRSHSRRVRAASC